MIKKENKITKISWVEGLKIAGFKTLLYELADDYKCDLRILEEDKGWFKVFIRFSVTGYQENVAKFFKEWNWSCDEYELRTTK